MPGQKMKIILDGSDAVVGTRATRRYAINLINEFASINKQDQFKIFLNYFRGNSKVINLTIKKAKNFSRRRYPMPRHISLPLWDKLNFPSIDIFTGKADIFHALGDDCPPVKSAKYIMTLHGIVYITVPELLDFNYVNYVKKKQAWLRKMSKRADYFIAVSNTTKVDFLKHFGFIDPERVGVIPLGIGSEFKILEKEMVKRELYRRFSITRPYILYVGVMEAHKNIEGIIRGFSYLANQYTYLDLIMVGSEEKQSSGIHDLIMSLKLDKRIRIMKYIGQEGDDLPILYNGAECFVFPSFSEGWTSPPLEAMACGIPVVTSNVSSLPETVGDAALLVNPKDYEGIGVAIEKLISGIDLRNRMIQKGLQHASKFTWKRCAESTLNFYRDIVESK
jgi:glycosyltransferase involved in cell wall biosynthesis